MADEKLELNPVGTICNPKPDPHTHLLEAWQSRDLDKFRSILQDPEVSPDHWYDDPHFGTCLYLVAKEDHGGRFARALVESGADVNTYNTTHKKYPIHVAVENGQDEVLEILLSRPGINVNALDNYGDTPLHVIAKHKVKNDSEDVINRYKRCVQLLMNQDKIEPNLTNKKGYTPIQWAARFGTKEVLQAILENAGDDLDVDTSVTLVKCKTARELILEKYPDLADILPEKQKNRDHKVDLNSLFRDLNRSDEDSFISKLKSLPDKELLGKHNGSCTLLQYAAEHGLFSAAQALVDSGAECHKTCECEQSTPALLACRGGYAKILDLLIRRDTENINLRDPKDKSTALHVIFNNPHVYKPSENKNYRDCFDILLKHLPKLKLDINATDKIGNTALHYAAKNGDEYAISALLKHGAYIGVKNVFGQLPLAHMSPDTLEKCLNECLDTNKKLPRENDYEVIFSYRFLVPPKNQNKCEEVRNHEVALTMPLQNNCDEEDHTPDQEPKLNAVTSNTETEPLLYISKSRDLKHLLKHPVFTSFLHLKWHQIRVFFYINLIFYVAFVALLTLHILYNYDNTRRPTTPSKDGNSTEELDLTARAKVPIADNSSVFWWIILVIFFFILVLRELFQIIVSPKLYLRSSENYLEILLFVVTGSILFSDWVRDNAKAHFSAVAILLSWAELVLLIGRHPRLSTNIEMFKTVSSDFLKFLAWYAILIFAFALSFYTLFRECGSVIECGEEGDSEENLFLSPGNSIFKTVVMLTGEFEATSIPFVSFPVTSHIVFVLFIFLIAIVLFNLLNGLAVSDTQAIRDDAEVISYISRVKFLSHIESMFQGSPIPFSESLKKFCCCWPADGYSLSNITGRVRLFPDKVPNTRIRVYPNLGGTILFSDDQKILAEIDKEHKGCCPSGCTGCTLEAGILKKSIEILSRRGQLSELEELAQRVERNEKRLEENQELLIEMKEMIQKMLSNQIKSGSGFNREHWK